MTARHRVQRRVARGLPPVAVDAAAVAEVIYMLLDNASKYAPREHRDPRDRFRRDALHVTIEVADQGPGIPPTLRERVFEKFFRVPGREPPTRSAPASDSACPSLAAWSRRRADACGSSRPTPRAAPRS